MLEIFNESHMWMTMIFFSLNLIRCKHKSMKTCANSVECWAMFCTTSLSTLFQEYGCILFWLGFICKSWIQHCMFFELFTRVLVYSFALIKLKRRNKTFHLATNFRIQVHTFFPLFGILFHLNFTFIWDFVEIPVRFHSFKYLCQLLLHCYGNWKFESFC